MELLPKEVILKVFSYLEAKELRHCSCTCRVFRECAEDESLWKELSLKEIIISQDTSPSSAAKSNYGLFAAKRKRLLLLERELDVEVLKDNNEATWKSHYKASLDPMTRMNRIVNMLERLMLPDTMITEMKEKTSVLVSGEPQIVSPVLAANSAAKQSALDNSSSYLSAFSLLTTRKEDTPLKPQNFQAMARFIEILVEPSMFIPYLLIKSVKHERNSYSFCCSLVDLFTAVGDVFSLLFCSIFDEVIRDGVEEGKRKDTAFRTESMFNRMLSHYFHLVGGPYLNLSLKAPLNKLLSDLSSNPPSNDLLTVNDPNFYYQLFLDSIIASLPSFPTEIQKICHYLHKEVGNPEKANFHVYLVLFYRFFCPAIMSYHSLQASIKSHLVHIAVRLRNEAREAIVPYLSTPTSSQADAQTTSEPAEEKQTNSHSRYSRDNINQIKQFFAFVIKKPSANSTSSNDSIRCTTLSSTGVSSSPPTDKMMSLVSNEQLKKAMQQIFHSFYQHKNDIYVELLALGQTERIHEIERVLHTLKDEMLGGTSALPQGGLLNYNDNNNNNNVINDITSPRMCTIC